MRVWSGAVWRAVPWLILCAAPGFAETAVPNHGLGTFRDGRAVSDDLIPPSGPLYCPQRDFCPPAHTPAVCAMDAVYRNDLYGIPQRITGNVSVSEVNYCKAAHKVCEVAAQVRGPNLPPEAQANHRPIYCYEPGDGIGEDRGKREGRVELTTQQTVDLRRVKAELKRVGLLGVVSVQDDRFSGKGLTLFARTEPGDETLICERVRSNGFLKDAIRECVPQAGRRGGLGTFDGATSERKKS